MGRWRWTIIPEGWEAGRATGGWEKRRGRRGAGSVLLSSHYVRAADENSHVQLLPGTRGLDLGFLHLDPTWMY